MFTLFSQRMCVTLGEEPLRSLSKSDELVADLWGVSVMQFLFQFLFEQKQHFECDTAA